MNIGLKEEDRRLLQTLATTFQELGKDLNANLKQLNANLEKLARKKR